MCVRLDHYLGMYVSILHNQSNAGLLVRNKAVFRLPGLACVHVSDHRSSCSKLSARSQRSGFRSLLPTSWYSSTILGAEDAPHLRSATSQLTRNEARLLVSLTCGFHRRGRGVSNAFLELQGSFMTSIY